MKSIAVSKEKFISILKEMEELHTLENTINECSRKCSNDVVSNFGEFPYLTCQDNMIVDLLGLIFKDEDTISWWIYELDFGKLYKEGCMTEVDGTPIDVSTADRLYDFLVNNM